MNNSKEISSVMDRLTEEADVTTTSVNEVKSKVASILEGLSSEMTIDVSKMKELVREALACSWWVEVPWVSPQAKWKAMINNELWKFASGELDANREYLLDQDGIPKNFTFILKSWWNLIRLMGWKIRFTWWMKRN